MIEVIRIGHAWTWQMICAAGGVLVNAGELYGTDATAIGAAKRYRARALAAAADVDHRQGACI